MLCFRKLLVVKKFMDTKGGGGFSKLSVKKFLSYSTKTFRRVTILCCVSEKFEL